MLEVRVETNLMMLPAASPAWTREAAWSLYRLPFNDLLFKAQTVHRQHFDPNRVQLSKLLNIKTGGCPEDCGYCSQSSHHSTGLAAAKLMDVEKVVTEARKAKASGATRYCMGAAWRNPKPRDMDAIVEMVGAVKSLGLETCMTLGMLDPRAVGPSQCRGARLLQSQYRYLGALLSEGDFDAQLCRSARYAGKCPAIRHESVLRWHPRHGRGGK